MFELIFHIIKYRNYNFFLDIEKNQKCILNYIISTVYGMGYRKKRKEKMFNDNDLFVLSY